MQYWQCGCFDFEFDFGYEIKLLLPLHWEPLCISDQLGFQRRGKKILFLIGSLIGSS